MTVRTGYQQLEDQRDALARGYAGGHIDLNTMDDVMALIKHAQHAAVLCVCSTPQAGNCSACHIGADLRNLGVPRLT